VGLGGGTSSGLYDSGIGGDQGPQPDWKVPGAFVFFSEIAFCHR
jgi:hypothetical protein